MDQPNLWGYTRELYQLPGIAETTAIDEIKTHYYTTHDELNPKRIIPRGPAGLGPDGAARARRCRPPYSTRVNQVTTIGSAPVSRQPGSSSSSATSSRHLVVEAPAAPRALSNMISPACQYLSPPSSNGSSSTRLDLDGPPGERPVWSRTARLRPGLGRPPSAVPLAREG